MEPNPDPTPPVVMPRYFFWVFPFLMLLQGGVYAWLFLALPRPPAERYSHLSQISNFSIILTTFTWVVLIPCWPAVYRHFFHHLRRNIRTACLSFPTLDPAEQRRHLKESIDFWMLRDDLAREHPWMRLYYYGGIMVGGLAPMVTMLGRIHFGWTL